MRQPWSSERCRCKIVDLVLRDLVDVPLRPTSTVKKCRATSSIAPRYGVPRVVDDPAAGDRPRSTLDGPRLDRRRQQLPQRLHPVEQPGRGLRAERDDGGGHVELVALGAHARVGAGQQQCDAARRRAGRGGDRQRVAGRRAEDAGEVVAGDSVVRRPRSRSPSRASTRWWTAPGHRRRYDGAEGNCGRCRGGDRGTGRGDGQPGRHGREHQPTLQTKIHARDCTVTSIVRQGS